MRLSSIHVLTHTGKSLIHSTFTLHKNVPVYVEEYLQEKSLVSAFKYVLINLLWVK